MRKWMAMFGPQLLHQPDTLGAAAIAGHVPSASRSLVDVDAKEAALREAAPARAAAAESDSESDVMQDSEEE